jgi:hypothetical protein
VKTSSPSEVGQEGGHDLVVRDRAARGGLEVEHPALGHDLLGDPRAVLKKPFKDGTTAVDLEPVVSRHSIAPRRSSAQVVTPRPRTARTEKYRIPLGTQRFIRSAVR